MLQVTVTVDPNGVIDCDSDDPCKVRGGNQTIRFMLDTDGYVFPDREYCGIDFKILNPDPPPKYSKSVDPDIFTNFTRAQQGKQVHVLDRNPKPKEDTYTEYRYSLTVVRTADGKEFSVDPAIRNYG